MRTFYQRTHTITIREVRERLWEKQAWLAMREGRRFSRIRDCT